MKISALGLFHTVIGVIAIVSAIVSLIKYGKINLAKGSGNVYLITTLITSLTALGISKHGGFNAGHVLTILVILLIGVAYFLHVKRGGNNQSRYVENFFLTFSFLLSWLPTVNETFTRVPVGHPLAKDISAPIIANTLLVLVSLFLVGSVFQFLRQRRLNRQVLGDRLAR